MFLGREVTRKQDYSENTATRIDEEVSDLLKEAYQRAKDILTRKRETMELLAGFLIERETLDATDVAEITEFGRILSESERAERKMEKERDGKAEQTEQAQDSVVRDGVAGPVAEDCPAGDQ